MELLGSAEADRSFAANMSAMARSCTQAALGVSLQEKTKTHREHTKESKARSKKLRKCTKCDLELGQESYSPNQWTKISPACKKCLGNA